MFEKKCFSAERIDTSKAHPARMYDFYLGGRDNYEVDREAAQRVIDAMPDVIPSVVASREFFRRAVRSVAESGVRQFLHIGTGIPFSPDTHEIARAVSPEVQVAYVDNDPIIAAHAGARLTNSGNAGFVLGDVREPRGILEDPTLREMLDFDQPIALVLVAVFHFITAAEDPYRIVAELREALPGGSYLILSHVTADFHGGSFPPEVQAVHDRATASLNPRTREAVARFFDGFDLVDPGLVQVPLWRPERPLPAPDELRRVCFYGGVGRKS